MYGLALRSFSAERASIDHPAGRSSEGATARPEQTDESAGPFTSRTESVGLKLPKRRLSTKDLLDSYPRRARLSHDKETGRRSENAA